MYAEYLHLEYRSRVYRLNWNFTVQSIISLKYISNYTCGRLCGPPFQFLSYFVVSAVWPSWSGWSRRESAHRLGCSYGRGASCQERHCRCCQLRDYCRCCQLRDYCRRCQLRDYCCRVQGRQDGDPGAPQATSPRRWWTQEAKQRRRRPVRGSQARSQAALPGLRRRVPCANVLNLPYLLNKLTVK